MQPETIPVTNSHWQFEIRLSRDWWYFGVGALWDDSYRFVQIGPVMFGVARVDGARASWQSMLRWLFADRGQVDCF
jgi:hypothetical protein